MVVLSIYLFEDLPLYNFLYCIKIVNALLGAKDDGGKERIKEGKDTLENELGQLEKRLDESLDKIFTGKKSLYIWSCENF